MVILILGGLLLVLAAGLYWLTGRWLSLYGIGVNKWSIRLLRTALVLLVAFLCRMWSATGLIVVHLAVLFMLLDFAAFVIRRTGRSHREKLWYQALRRVYRSGLAPVVITCLLIGYGCHNLGNIVPAEYTIVTEKTVSDYKVVFISDIHYDTVQDPKILKGKIDEINACAPDLIVLGGDIVEEGTSKSAMEEVFRVLGRLKSTYGTYYVYGNHDRQDYADMTSRPRTYTREELQQAIESNGINILCDKWVPVGDDLIVEGRDDASKLSGRASAEELLRDADRGRFIIAADHQPVEMKENAEQGVDLQLSGHTHAGQIFPVGYFTEWFLSPNYGKYEEDGCTLIVSSGAAGWGFPIRTEGKCEYVVINITS